jgi:endonuclease-3
MNKKQIDEVFSILQEDNPEPGTELTYVNDFTLLVAIILSAQSTDAGVNKATPALFKVASSPEAMLELGEDKLKVYIKSIGLFNSKAKNIIELSRILCERYESQIPECFETLTKLPGIGRKTAAVYLNTAHGVPIVGVDTHVFRVSNRIGLVKAKTIAETERKLTKTIPDKWKKYLNHWLTLHGRYVCKAKQPECDRCIIAQLCEFYTRSRLS